MLSPPRVQRISIDKKFKIEDLKKELKGLIQERTMIEVKIAEKRARLSSTEAKIAAIKANKKLIKSKFFRVLRVLSVTLFFLFKYTI